MAEIHPRIRRIRRISVSVFVALAIASIPIAMHIKETRSQPELWLTLLGAVLMMVLISLFALETAAAPIPEPAYTPEDEEELVEPEELPPIPVETIIDQPPSHWLGPTDLSEQDTELDPERFEPRMNNPDGPMLVVPNPALNDPSSATDPECEPES